MRDEFLSYDFPTGEVHGLCEEVSQAWKRVMDLDGVPPTMKLETDLIKFRADLSRVDQASIRQD